MKKDYRFQQYTDWQNMQIEKEREKLELGIRDEFNYEDIPDMQQLKDYKEVK